MRVATPFMISLSVATTVWIAIVACADTHNIILTAQRILSQPRDMQMRELADALTSLDQADQADLLRQISRNADPSIASQACSFLIQRDELDDATLDFLDLQIQEWISAHQLFVVQAIRDRPSVHERRRYATVLRMAHTTALDRDGAANDAKNLIVISESVLALYRMDDPLAVSDAKTIIQRTPTSSGAWIVLIDSGEVGDAERANAQSILDDDTQRVPLRVLAAIALGDQHPVARTYAESIVNGILDEYGAMTLDEMIMAAMLSRRDNPSQESINIKFLRDSRPVLSYMSLVTDGSLDPTLRRCASAQNESIRDMARYAIATSSPSLVLEDPPCISDATLLIETAAAAAILHPDMRDAIDQRFGAENIEAVLPQVRGDGGSIRLGRSGPPTPCQP